MVLDDVHEPPSIVSLLEESLVEKDDARDALKLGLAHSEQELPVVAKRKGSMRYTVGYFRCNSTNIDKVSVV